MIRYIDNWWWFVCIQLYTKIVRLLFGGGLSFTDILILFDFIYDFWKVEIIFEEGVCLKQEQTVVAFVLFNVKTVIEIKRKDRKKK